MGMFDGDSASGGMFGDVAPPRPKPASVPTFHQLLQGGKKNIDAAANAAKFYGTHPIETMNAITYPVGRAIEGGISGALGPHNGTNPITDTLGSMWQGAVHPGARVALDRSVEQRLGIKPNKALERLQPVSNMFGAIAPMDANAGMAKGMLDMVISLSKQSGVDAAVEEIANLPAYMTKELDGVYWALRGGGGAMSMLLHRMLGTEGVRNLMSHLDAFHNIKREIAPKQAAVIRGEAAIRRNSAREGKQRANQVLAGHEETLRNLGQTVHGEGSRLVRRQTLAANPATKPIVDELDRVSWVEGTQQVRDQMRQHGYNPPPDVAHLPPGNTLHHWDESYFPTQEVKDVEQGGIKGALASWRKRKTNAAGYNLQGGDGRQGDNVAEQLRQRIASGYRNAAEAQFQRESIRAGQAGALPHAEMTEVDLNNPKAKTGNIFQPYSEAIQKVKLRDIREGNSPAAAFQPMQTPSRINRDIPVNSGGEIRRKIKLKPLERAKLRAEMQLERAKAQAQTTSAATSKFGLERQKAVSEAANNSAGDLSRDLFKMAGNADAAANTTNSAAAKAALGTQQKVSQAADALRTKLALRGQGQIERLLKGRGDDIKSPLAKTIARMRDEQATRGGADFMPVRNAALTKNLDQVIKPSEKVAKQAGELAGKAMNHDYHSGIHMAAIGGKVDNILKASKINEAAAARRLVTTEGNLNAARTVNETVDRISSYLEEELARSGKLTIPKSVEDLLFNRPEHQAHFGLDKLANVFRDATFALPYVHGWNIITQTLANGLGPEVVAKGMAYSRRLAAGDPELKAAQAELKRLGQAAEYSGHDEPAFAKLPKVGPMLASLSEKGQQTLDNIDHGIKIAAMEKFAKEGLSGPMLGARIEDVYGNPEGSNLSNFLRSIGGFFPNWRVNVLPKTIYAGLKSEKGRKAIGQMNWLQNYATQESEDPENQKNGAHPTEFNMFPALNEGQQLMFGGPYGAANYLTSTGTLGIIPEMIQRKSESGSTALSRSLLESTPFSSDLSRIGGDAINKDPVGVLRDLLEVVGPRLTPETRKQLQQKLKYLPQTYEGL